MLVGVSGIDCVLLVVVVDDGLMLQICEYLVIVELFGICWVLVVLIKIDWVELQWVQQVWIQVEYLLVFGLLVCLLIFLFFSSIGEGVEVLCEVFGGFVGEVCECSCEGYFCLVVDWVFSVVGSGIVVIGMVFFGQVVVGDELFFGNVGWLVWVCGLYVQNWFV